MYTTLPNLKTASAKHLSHFLPISSSVQEVVPDIIQLFATQTIVRSSRLLKKCKKMTKGETAFTVTSLLLLLITDVRI